MGYSVKETYLTLQGEGARTGQAAVFCRFAGCNLWTGREEDRAAAHCRFCDTDFIGTDGHGGGKFSSADTLAQHIRSVWDKDTHSDTPGHGSARVVFTGGEPLLQLDDALIRACHQLTLEVAIETNGTVKAPPGIDWICVSPKPGLPLLQREGHELKLIYPQPEPHLGPENFTGLSFQNFFLQPMDGPQRDANTQKAIAYCLRYPQWRLSLQTHKLIGIP